MPAPDIRIHCPDPQCNGIRTFRSNSVPSIYRESASDFLDYECSDCRSQRKRFAVLISRLANDNAKIFKYGEAPPFGPPTPPRLQRLFGKTDLDLFMKGRRCESQGLGVGAFAYYRRVVENHKKQIFEEIIKVAERVGASKDKISALKQGANEIQFKKSVEDVKDAIPESLLINGHNPLTLLHAALSEHLHERTDDECLALAQAARVVLVELSDKISNALKEEAELSDAVKRLLNKGKS